MLSSNQAELSIGSDCLPSQVMVRDALLKTVAEGVTPLHIRVPPDLYEIEIRSGIRTIKKLIKARPGEQLDASDLGLPVKTAAPIIVRSCS